jgi:hypothetical protein
MVNIDMGSKVNQIFAKQTKELQETLSLLATQETCLLKWQTTVRILLAVLHFSITLDYVRQAATVQFMH